MNLWQNGQYLWNIFFSGIHIPSRPVVPEDNNLVQMIKITSKSPQSDEWGFAQPQNLFHNSYIILYIFPVFWQILIGLKLYE